MKTRIRFHPPLHFGFKEIFARVSSFTLSESRPSP